MFITIVLAVSPFSAPPLPPSSLPNHSVIIVVMIMKFSGSFYQTAPKKKKEKENSSPNKNSRVDTPLRDCDELHK